MGLFGRPDPRDVVIAQLKAELSDLRSLQKEEREQFSRERAQLLEHMMALANPGSLREMRRPASSEGSGTPASALRATSAYRSYYPRSDHLVYPPYPPHIQSSDPSIPDPEGNA